MARKVRDEVPYSDTTGQVARDASCDTGTVRAYADMGLIKSIRASDGRRMFQPGTAERVREIKNARLANRLGLRNVA